MHGNSEQHPIAYIHNYPPSTLLLLLVTQDDDDFIMEDGPEILISKWEKEKEKEHQYEAPNITLPFHWDEKRVKKARGGAKRALKVKMEVQGAQMASGYEHKEGATKGDAEKAEPNIHGLAHVSVIDTYVYIIIRIYGYVLYSW